MKKIFFTLLVSLLTVIFLQAQTWDGSTSSDWNTGSNWSTNAVPLPAGNVIIPGTGVTNWPNLPANTTVNNFDMTAGSQLNFNGFTLTINGNYDVRGAMLNNTNGATDIEVTVNGNASNYFGSSTINDNYSLTLNGDGALYEGYILGNTFNGNAAFNYDGTGTTYISYNQKSAFNGNLTVNRTTAGTTYIFYSGYNGVTGNFSYTNTIGGPTYINHGSVPSGDIGGTINITATGAGNPVFQLYKITNLTEGGTISVQNSGAVEIEDDTLKVVALNVNGATTSGSDWIRRNLINGTLSYSDAAGNTGSIYLDGNTINGNTDYAMNSAIPVYEGYVNGNTYNGNTNLSITGTGTLYISYNQKSTFNGNLIVNRTGAGITYVFNSGHNGVTGNFSYTNATGGATYINHNGVASGVIGGTINITATGAGNPIFQLYKTTNLTAGGTISVQNSGAVEIEDDTLKVVALNVNGTTTSGSDWIRRNSIDGNLSFSDAAGNTGSVYLDGNTINGTAVYTSNAAIPWYESYVGSNIYNGNITFNRVLGTINFAYSDTTYVNANLVFNSTAGITVNNGIRFGGGTNATFEQLGTQPIITPKLIIDKTSGANLTLNDSVMVTTAAGFVSGNIISSTTKELVFDDGATNSGASATSHVIGPVTKIGNDIFTFPLGGPVSYNPIGMTAPVGVTSRFRAEYKNQNPTSDGFNTNSKAGTLNNVSKTGYWYVQREIGATNVNLTLGFATNPYEQYPVITNLKVAEWSGTQWDDKGLGSSSGNSALGTITNATALTYDGQFAIANVTPTYFYVYSNPGTGPDGTPLKIKATGGWPAYQTKQLPAGTYSADSIYLVPNATAADFKLRDVYSVEKDDTTIIAPTAPTTYISANGNGTVSFSGWRHYVYLKNGSNEIIGAIRDNDLTLGNTTMTAYFSTPNVATAPNGNIYLKRSFKITSEFAPVGTKRVRLYISKTEYNNLVAADPASFPNGINSLTITKYTGPQEDSLFNPIPGGNSIIIPNSAITIADLGTMYSLDIDVTGFSGFYIGGNQSNVSLCNGSSISIPSDISGASYQWQVDNGSGYTNISNGGVYSGVTTNTLALSSVPATMYGYNLRCVVNGGSFSQVYTLKFKATWQGTVSNVWENTANWNCGILPDGNTDVIISGGKANYPAVNSNTTIRTLTLSPGVTATVNTGVTLTILQ
jgi:hypothetical protein